jgi:hypothetical protein
MIRRSTLLMFTALLAFAFLMQGCSKKDSSPTEAAVTAPTIPTLTFKGPNTTSTETNAQMIKSYVSAMNSYTTMFAPYMLIQSVQSGNTWTWTYTEGTLTVKMTSTAQSDGTYLWKLIFNGKDPSDGTTYSNWTGMEGTTSADGKSGSWKIYNDNTTTVVADFSWATTNNVLTGTQKAYTNGTSTGQIVVVNNPDNTGEMRTYTGSVMTYKATWTATGSGQWWTYNSSGTQTGTGTWS